jgi:hypothetical protein
VAGLLEEAIEAHGGARRWKKVSEIGAHVRSGGLLMRVKGRSRSFIDYGLNASTRKQSAVFEPYPEAGTSGLYAGDSVRVLATDGSIVEERDDPRAAFAGLPGLRRNLRWDALDGLYFAGYAMWNYLNLPFLLSGAGFETSEGEPIEADGERWRRLDATFPEGVHTHCPEQTFYFDDRGLLRRHDYTPDVVSSLANAAHFCDEHVEVDGLTFPTRRRVVPKGPGGRPLAGPTVVWIELSSITVG